MRIVAIDYDGTLTEGSLYCWAAICDQFRRLGFAPYVASYNSGPDPKEVASLLGIGYIKCQIGASKAEAFRLAGLPRPAIWVDDMPETCCDTQVLGGEK